MGRYGEESKGTGARKCSSWSGNFEDIGCNRQLCAAWDWFAYP